MNRLSDLTLGDIAKGLGRYRPFILTVVAIAMIAVLLPGHGKEKVRTGGAAEVAGPQVTPPQGQQQPTNNVVETTIAPAGGQGDRLVRRVVCRDIVQRGASQQTEDGQDRNCDDNAERRSQSIEGAVGIVNVERNRIRRRHRDPSSWVRACLGWAEAGQIIARRLMLSRGR